MFSRIVGSVLKSKYSSLLSCSNLESVFNYKNVLTSILRNNSLTYYSTIAPAKKEIDCQSGHLENKILQDTVSKIENQLAKGEEGRLFAIVHLCGKQFKVTAEDIIIIEGYWPPQPSQQINLEKVMLVGGTDFTLVGKPLLPPGLVSVKATVIEKDLSHTKPLFYKRRRKQYMRLNFYRSQQTMLRINDISIIGEINQPEDTIQHISRI